ncbi:MAG TPA: glycosyl transferase [Bacteroidetes bacterium]|nr:glycosyl transferase [Bacteroidota bacterium]
MLDKESAYAPIALFCFNRPDHLKRTVEALLKNPEASGTAIHFFSDAAARPRDQVKVDAVRAFIRSVSGFKEIHIHEAATNIGLSQSVISGVSSILEKEPGIIVLEDDMECQPFFLRYMNEALAKYEFEERVVSIHAYSYPIPDLPDSFFLKGADCWGWATWKRGWELFEEDGNLLLEQVKKQKLQKRLDFSYSYPYLRMLKRQIRGENQSWAVRWYASALIKDKLTLYPGRSLIRNIGNDSTGTHSRETALFDPILADTIPEFPFTVEESPIAYKAFVKFFRRLKIRMILKKFGLKK